MRWRSQARPARSTSSCASATSTTRCSKGSRRSAPTSSAPRRSCVCTPIRKACCRSSRAGSSAAALRSTSSAAAGRRSRNGSSRSWAKIRGRADDMHGTLLIARLTWLETRRRKIALAALICGLLFLAVFGTAMYFGFNLARAGGPLGDAPPDPVGMRVAATVLTVGLYVVNFLVNAVAILLPIDSLSGEIGSGVIQTLASKPVDRAAIVVGKWLAYLLMTAAYLVLMAGGVVVIMRFCADYTAPAVVVPMGLMLLGAATMLSITIAGGVRLSTITNGIVAFGFYGVE